jgi:hypothetical protein
MGGVDLRRRAMAEATFWELVAVMGGSTDEDAVRRLTEALRDRGPKAARPFAERLAKVLHELDREELFGQPVRFDDEDPADLDDPDVEPLPLSDDSFLYLRAGIVARGRSAYERVLADPRELGRGTWPECEELLYVADEVAGNEIETRTSYETGSNTRHWSDPPDEPQRDTWDVGPRAVWVDVRDLSDPIEGEVHHADGRVEQVLEHGEPRWLARGLSDELTVVPSRLVTVGGGLPAGCGAQIQVRLDVGDGWQLPPRDEGLVADTELLGGDVRRVTASVDHDTVRGWDGRVRRDALLGLAAQAVLQVLPDDHAARAPLQELAVRGAGHLPG